MNTKHAILYYPDRPFPNTSLLWIEDKQFRNEELPDPCYNALQVAAAAYKRDITHVWVSPGYGEIATGASYGDWSIKSHARRGKTTLVSVWKRGEKRGVNIIFPQNTAWTWMQGAGPHEMLIALRYLEQALVGTPVGSSPARVGWNYLKRIHPEWIEEMPSIDWKAMHFTSAAAPDIIWQRPLLPDEHTKKYLHKYDKNAAYPYAATQTAIGVGTPVHKDHGRDMDDFVTSKGTVRASQSIGVWRVTVNGHVDVSMPPIWHKREGWLAGPIVRLLRSAGAQVTVHEGYVFPDQHNVMTAWAIDLWNARQHFAESGAWRSAKGAALAYKATKQIMNSTIGMTAFRGFEDDDEMRRPDIRVQVIARHTELTWHNINKVCQLYGVTPVIVYMDALYYLSDEPDGRKALSDLVKREGQMGGYKYEGRVPMEQAHIILEAKMSEGEKLEHLNKVGWVK